MRGDKREKERMSDDERRKDEWVEKETRRAWEREEQGQGERERERERERDDE